MSEFVKAFLSFSLILECYCAVLVPRSSPLDSGIAEREMAVLIAAVRSSTPSSMVVVGVS